MRSLFAGAAEDKQRSVIFLGKEFEAGWIFERVYGILLGEVDAVGALEGVEVFEELLYESRTGITSKKEGALGVFVDLRLSLFQRSL